MWSDFEECSDSNCMLEKSSEFEDFAHSSFYDHAG